MLSSESLNREIRPFGIQYKEGLHGVVTFTIQPNPFSGSFIPGIMRKRRSGAQTVKDEEQIDAVLMSFFANHPPDLKSFYSPPPQLQKDANAIINQIAQSAQSSGETDDISEWKGFQNSWPVSHSHVVAAVEEFIPRMLSDPTKVVLYLGIDDKSHVPVGFQISDDDLRRWLHSVRESLSDFIYGSSKTPSPFFPPLPFDCFSLELNAVTVVSNLTQSKRFVPISNIIPKQNKNSVNPSGNSPLGQKLQSDPLTCVFLRSGLLDMEYFIIETSSSTSPNSITLDDSKLTVVDRYTLKITINIPQHLQGSIVYRKATLQNSIVVRGENSSIYHTMPKGWGFEQCYPIDLWLLSRRPLSTGTILHLMNPNYVKIKMSDCDCLVQRGEPQCLSGFKFRSCRHSEIKMPKSISSVLLLVCACSVGQSAAVAGIGQLTSIGVSEIRVLINCQTGSNAVQLMNSFRYKLSLNSTTFDVLDIIPHWWIPQDFVQETHLNREHPNPLVRSASSVSFQQESTILTEASFSSICLKWHQGQTQSKDLGKIALTSLALRTEQYHAIFKHVKKIFEQRQKTNDGGLHFIPIRQLMRGCGTSTMLELLHNDLSDHFKNTPVWFVSSKDVPALTLVEKNAILLLDRDLEKYAEELKAVYSLQKKNPLVVVVRVVLTKVFRDDTPEVDYSPFLTLGDCQEFTNNLSRWFPNKKRLLDEHLANVSKHFSTNIDAIQSHERHLFSFLLIVTKLKEGERVKSVETYVEEKLKSYSEKLRQRLLFLSMLNVFASGPHRFLTLDQFADDIDIDVLPTWDASDLWSVVDFARVSIWHVWIAHLILKSFGYDALLLRDHTFDSALVLFDGFRNSTISLINSQWKYQRLPSFKLNSLPEIITNVLIKSKLVHNNHQEFAPLIQQFFCTNFSGKQLLELCNGLFNWFPFSDTKGVPELNVHLHVLASRICRLGHEKLVRVGQSPMLKLESPQDSPRSYAAIAKTPKSKSDAKIDKLLTKAEEYAKLARSVSSEMSVRHNLAMVYSACGKFLDAHNEFSQLFDSATSPKWREKTRIQLLANAKRWKQQTNESVLDTSKWEKSSVVDDSIVHPLPADHVTRIQQFVEHLNMFL